MPFTTFLKDWELRQDFTHFDFRLTFEMSLVIISQRRCSKERGFIFPFFGNKNYKIKKVYAQFTEWGKM